MLPALRNGVIGVQFHNTGTGRTRESYSTTLLGRPKRTEQRNRALNSTGAPSGD